MFNIKGDLEKVFDLTERYMSAMKFRIVNSVKPSLLVLERGSVWAPLYSFKVEDYKTTLTISFSKKEGEVIVFCDYDVKGYGSIFTSSDKSTLETEIELLRRFLETSIQI
ncbi:MAG: hypothetical protein QXI11_05450 [Thermoproteota archaeon]